MKVGIIGTGYVGLPTGVGLAELGNSVVCVDKVAEKIDMLNAGKLPIYEDSLDELFFKNVKNGRLKFTTSMKEAVAEADIVLITVGTPPHPVTHEADLTFIYQAAEELAEHLTGYMVVATKSTVPVGTGDEIEKIIGKKNPNADFDVISLPEFLREGYAIHDFFNPDRIIIGTNSIKAKSIMEKLYQPFAEKTNILFVSRKSSETIKYASNAFLAMKIHYINEIANFCEKTGANVAEVAKGMGLDKRIGNRFLNAGIGFGGSCFPKDTMAMAYMGQKAGAPIELIEATIKGNNKRKEQMAERILNAVCDLDNPKIINALIEAHKRGVKIRRVYDYSDKKYNLNGRICLETTIPFGLGGIFIMYIINPIVTSIIGKLGSSTNVIAIILAVLFLIDLVVSTSVVAKVRTYKVTKFKDDTEKIKKEVK